MNDAQLHQLFLATLKDDPIRQDKPVNHTHTLGLNSIVNSGSHNHSYTAPIWALPNQSDMERMRRQIETNIYEQRILTNQLTKQAQEKPMSTLDKIKQERREKREREELEAKFEAWDVTLTNALVHGDVLMFSVELSDKWYKYAALWVDKRWFLTGQVTCGMATEEFIAWLIDKNVDEGNVLALEPVE